MKKITKEEAKKNLKKYNTIFPPMNMPTIKKSKEKTNGQS